MKRLSGPGEKRSNTKTGTRRGRDSRPHGTPLTPTERVLGILHECSSTDSQKSPEEPSSPEKSFVQYVESVEARQSLLEQKDPPLSQLELGDPNPDRCVFIPKFGCLISRINDQVPSVNSTIVDDNPVDNLIFSFKIGHFNQIRIRANPKRYRKINKKLLKNKNKCSTPQPFFKTSEMTQVTPSPLLLESIDAKADLDQSQMSICFPNFGED